MRYAIRPAVERDVPGIVTVESAAGRLPASGAVDFSERIRAAVADPGRLVLVAEGLGGPAVGDCCGVVGWAKTHYYDVGDGPAPAGHYLGGITVAADYRRRGVATAMTTSRLEWIWERADAAWYVVNARNSTSLALHQQWGFREVARGAAFHTVTFDGGEGVLLTAARPPS